VLSQREGRDDSSSRPKVVDGLSSSSPRRASSSKFPTQLTRGLSTTYKRVQESELRTYLDGSSEQMTVMRFPCREGRSVEESERLLSLGLLERSLESIDVSPVLKNNMLLSREVERAR